MTRRYLLLLKSDYVKLCLIVGLAFFLVFSPHIDYPYPLHLDEWSHLAYSNAMSEAGNVTVVDPFDGQFLWRPPNNQEGGFHLLWAVFRQVSGVSWELIFRYFPGLVFTATVLAAYIFSRRLGTGWESAFFVSLIPTTVGILGPVFLVPVAMGLFFVTLCLFVAFNPKSLWSYITLFIFVLFVLIMHSITSVVLVLMIVPFIILNFRSRFRHSLFLTLALAIPLLATFPWIAQEVFYWSKTIITVKTEPTWFVAIPRIIQLYGYLPVSLGLLGSFVLLMSADKRRPALALGLLAVLLMLVAFYQFQYGIGILYERGLLYMMLILSITAGFGLHWIRTLRLPNGFSRIFGQFLVRNAGNILAFTLIAVTLVLTIPERQSTAYYHMINREDYEVFTWIRENVDGTYEKAILDPWKATAFTAITGKYVYSRTHAYPDENVGRVSQFFDNDSSDTEFLKENGITIVYTDTPVENPNLTEIRENVFLLK